jgi:ubiquinone biosynthesis protein
VSEPIGRYLALRPDLLAPRRGDQAWDLPDQAPPLPWPQAEALLEAALGRPPDAVFEHLNRHPFSSRTLAQLHEATLPDGTPVVVKIARPGGLAAALGDLERAGAWRDWLEPAAAGAAELVEDLGEALRREADLERALAGLERAHREAAGERVQAVPRPYPGHCGPAVATFERLEGVALGHLVGAVPAGAPGDAVAERLDRLGIDGERLARHLLTACLRQVFRWRLFATDLHPSNLVALRDEAVGWVDFAGHETLGASLRDRLARFLDAVVAGEAEAMLGDLADLASATRSDDLVALRGDFLPRAKEALARDPDDGPDDAGGERGRPLVSELVVLAARSARRVGLSLPAPALAALGGRACGRWRRTSWPAGASKRRSPASRRARSSTPGCAASSRGGRATTTCGT